MVATGYVCDCEPVPVNIWRHPDGTWTLGALITMDGAEADAAEYIANGCTAWVIACPECGGVIAVGATS